MAALDSLLSRSDKLLRELRESRSSSASSARGARPDGLSVARAAGLGALSAGTRGSLAEHSFMRGGERLPTPIVPPNTIAVATAMVFVDEDRASLSSLAGHYVDSPAPSSSNSVGLLERLRASYAAEACIAPGTGTRAARGWGAGDAPDGSARDAAIAVAADAALDTYLPTEKLHAVVAAAKIGRTQCNLEERVAKWAKGREQAFTKRHECLHWAPGGAPQRAPLLRWGDVVDAYIACVAADNDANVNCLLNRLAAARSEEVLITPPAPVLDSETDDDDDADAAATAAIPPQPIAIVRPDGSGLGGATFHLAAKLKRPVVAGRTVVVYPGGLVYRKNTLSAEEVALVNTNYVAYAEGFNANDANANATLTSGPQPRPPLLPPRQMTKVTSDTLASATSRGAELATLLPSLNNTTASTLIETSFDTTNKAPARVISASSSPLKNVTFAAAPLMPSVSSLHNTNPTPLSNAPSFENNASAPAPLSSFVPFANVSAPAPTASALGLVTAEAPVAHSVVAIAVAVDTRRASMFQPPPPPTLSSSVTSPPPLALIDCVPLLESAAQVHADTLAVLHPAQTLRVWHCFIDAAGGLAPLAAAASTGTGLPRQHPVLAGGPAHDAHLSGPTLAHKLAATRVLLPNLLAVCARLGYNGALLHGVRSDASACIAERGGLHGLSFADVLDFVAGVLTRGSDAHAATSSHAARAVAIATAQSTLAVKSAEAAAAADALRVSMGLAPRRSVTAASSLHHDYDTLAAGAAAVLEIGILSDVLQVNAETTLYTAIPCVAHDGVITHIAPLPLSTTAAIRDGRECAVLIHMVDGWLGPPGTDPWYQPQAAMNYELYATQVLRSAPSVELVMQPAALQQQQLATPAAAADLPPAEVLAIVPPLPVTPSPPAAAVGLPIAPPLAPTHPFALGTLVFARFKGGNTAFRGTVAGARLVRLRESSVSGNAVCFYSIAYDDGDEEDDVAARFVRYRGPTNDTASPPPALPTIESAKPGSATALTPAPEAQPLEPPPAVETTTVDGSSTQQQQQQQQKTSPLLLPLPTPTVLVEEFTLAVVAALSPPPPTAKGQPVLGALTVGCSTAPMPREEKVVALPPAEAPSVPASSVDDTGASGLSVMPPADMTVPTATPTPAAEIPTAPAPTPTPAPAHIAQTATAPLPKMESKEEEEEGGGGGGGGRRRSRRTKP